VISTRGTHTSGAYLDAFAAAPQVEVTSTPCPRFVEFVESGVTTGDELISVARDYLAPVQARGVDTLILGCTHYPLLTGVISYVMGDAVTLVSSADETAKDVFRVLADRGELRADDLPQPEHAFLTTGDPEEFARLSRRFLGPEAVPARAEEVATA
jgi:glutamate racemase